MPELILSDDEHASHVQLTLTTTSDATANGIDTNSATARLNRHGQPLSGQELHFTLSGDARFVQGGQRATATTDIRGEARVAFTDTRQETVVVTSHYRQTQATENSRFSAAVVAGLNLSAAVSQNGVQANGVSRNGLLYTVYNQSGAPVPNITLDFSTTGSAVLTVLQGLTNINGQVSLTLSNAVAEQVMVSARVRNNIGSDNYTFVNFSSVLAKYRIIAHVLSRDTSPPNQENGISYQIIDNITNQGVPGILLDYDIPSTLQSRNLGPTNASGITYLYLNSSATGSFRIRASINLEPTTINFTQLRWA